MEEEKNLNGIVSSGEEINETPQPAEEQTVGEQPAEEKKPGAGARMKSSFGSRKFKGGAYSFIVSIVVIALFVIINLIVTEEDKTFDLTTLKTYSITDETIDYIKNIDDEITIYYLTEEGGGYEIFEKLMNRFEENSSNIKIVIKDPAKYPMFAKQYTDEDVQQHSVIVVNNTTDVGRYIPYTDMVISEINYQTYTSEITGVDVEGQILSAIRYVSSENVPVMGILSGHQEFEITSEMEKSIAKENVDTVSVNLSNGGEIPENCEMLFINHPYTDFLDTELETLKNYVNNGGKVLLLLDVYTSGCENIRKFLSYYGLKMSEGVVVEGDNNHMMNGMPTWLAPDMCGHDITQGLEEKIAVMPTCTGLVKEETARSTITVTPILMTSDDAYLKVNPMAQTTEKEDGDIDGPFMIGAEMSETYNGVTGKLIVFTSNDFLDDSVFRISTFANADIFLNSVDYLADVEQTVNVRATSLSEDAVTIDTGSATMLGIVYMAAIPALFILAGIFVTVRRRKMK